MVQGCQYHPHPNAADVSFVAGFAASPEGMFILEPGPHLDAAHTFLDAYCYLISAGHENAVQISAAGRS